MNKIYNSIGNTPLVLVDLDDTRNNSRVYAKLEYMNPGGSVKDRPAKNMLSMAIERGELAHGDHFIEATSGNTGIALAMIGSAMGLKPILVMPANATEERKKTMRSLGAQLIETDPELGIEHARKVAKAMAHEKSYYLINQFDNTDNWQSHFMTTGPEILRQTMGRISHFVSSMGTTGTITGTGKFLKMSRSNIHIVGVQPEDGARIPGIRKWSRDMLPKIYDSEVVDSIKLVSRENALRMSKELSQKHGIFAGISAGGAAYIAKELAQKYDHLSIVFIACDGGDRYLSDPNF